MSTATAIGSTYFYDICRSIMLVLVVHDYAPDVAHTVSTRLAMSVMPLHLAMYIVIAPSGWTNIPGVSVVACLWLSRVIGAAYRSISAWLSYSLTAALTAREGPLLRYTTTLALVLDVVGISLRTGIGMYGNWARIYSPDQYNQLYKVLTWMDIIPLAAELLEAALQFVVLRNLAGEESSSSAALIMRCRWRYVASISGCFVTYVLALTIVPADAVYLSNALTNTAAAYVQFANVMTTLFVAALSNRSQAKAKCLESTKIQTSAGKTFAQKSMMASHV
ncbi:hypothetical protein HK405_013092 [Cladochytrium tenue]|nr:hypothetical protein HK405_013092 [Cladochytrium tenue]